MSSRAEASPQTYARVCGWIYLVSFVAGIFADGYVASKLVLAGDAAATAHNIVASESLWRVGFVADIVGLVSYVAVTLLLYILLRPVNANISLLAAFFSLTGCATLGVALLGFIAPTIVLGGGGYLSAFDPHQLQAMALLSLKLYGNGYAVAIVFFACYCLTLGFLISGPAICPGSSAFC